MNGNLKNSSTPNKKTPLGKNISLKKSDKSFLNKKIRSLASNSALNLEGPERHSGFAFEQEKNISNSILIGAGDKLHFYLTEKTHTLEFKSDLENAFPSKIRLIACAVKDVISATLGIPLNDITITPTLLLNDNTHEADPFWRLQFRSADKKSMKLIEDNLNYHYSLLGCHTDVQWKSEIERIMKDCSQGASIVDITQGLRDVIGEKAIPKGITVTSPEFGHPITLPETIRSTTKERPKNDAIKYCGEVVGYNRSSRLVYFLKEGHQASTQFNMDMETFQNTVQQIAPEENNRCTVHCKPHSDGDKITGESLCQLEFQQKGLFAKIPYFDPITANKTD